MSTTTFIVPKDSTFKLRQGHFPSKLTSYNVKDVETARGTARKATILYEVFVPGMKNYECLARKILFVDPKAGSEFRRFLTGLLGADFWRGRSNQPVDLKAELEGRLCEVILVHAKHDEDKFDFPLVDVESMHPPRPEPAKEADPKQ